MITGLYGCSCHPFNSWKECDKEHSKQLRIGDKVTNRHSNKVGVIHEILKDNGFVTVKYGEYQRDIELEHVAQLILTSNQLSLF